MSWKVRVEMARSLTRELFRARAKPDGDQISRDALTPCLPLARGRRDQTRTKSLLGGSAGLGVVLAFAHKLVTLFAVDALGIGFL